MALNLRHQKFVAEYLKSGNATQAAAKAGYNKRTARSQGSRLLTNADICAALNAEKAQVASNARLTVEGHLETLASLRDGALRDGAHGAAVTAEVSRGKVCGLYVEKVDVTSAGKPLADTERQSRLDAMLATLAKRMKR